MGGVCLSPPFARFLPPHGRGQRIGLLGGSFNPAHAAHRQISLIALRRLKLDAIWWLVTPGNPLKENSGLPELSKRMHQARQLAHHPKIYVTAMEAALGTRYTIDTLRYLLQRCTGTDFVWLMGSDNLVSFHRWKQWQQIAALVPMAIIDRPATTLKATQSRAAHFLGKRRLHEQFAASLLGRKAPAWVFVHDRRSALSSTALREKKL
jgi:nicotinate-nucleotide adenylyltransferase